MNPCSQDWELLQEYVFRGSEQAFSLLVERHADMVWSAALRQVRDRELAEEVAQIVFIVLAKKAKSIKSDIVLAAWLQKTTRYTALNVMRTEGRRRAHERKAAEMARESYPRVDSSWKWLSPVLDEGIARLGDRDRAAVMLRFFEHKSFAEIGMALGITENAAGMRISRAVEKLRNFFQRRGVSLSSPALGGILTANSVHAAPAGLAAGIAREALHTLSGTALNSASAMAAANAVVRMMVVAQAKFLATVAVMTLAVGLSLGMLTNYIVMPLLQHTSPPAAEEHSSASLLHSGMIRERGMWFASHL